MALIADPASTATIDTHAAIDRWAAGEIGIEMELDYGEISAANTQRYGTEVGEYGPVLLANLYADRTHFIFELLQNAEDALRRRRGWSGRRNVRFDIGENSLTVTHYGRPFDQDDVRGISGIALSTKRATDIGRFGIGFKSVYAWTDRPEVHSGDHDFAITDYVHPARVESISRKPQATVIVLPFKEEVAAEREQIVEALERDMGAAIRFLREIEEIEWRIGAERRGQFLAERRQIAVGVEHLTIIGQLADRESTEEWLVFSDTVRYEDQDVGSLELAFALDAAVAGEANRFRRLSHSPLAVFFPTDHETHLRFLAQGPYRTTPSRDNVLKQDRWNTDLVQQSATLLQRALFWLRDQDELDPGVLECLPLDPGKFDSTNMFSPLFEATKDSLASERLLPAHPDGYAFASQSVLGGTEAVRELFDPGQLAELFGAEAPLTWLSSAITPARTPDLYEYLRRELGLREAAGAEILVRQLSESFLEAQSDEWIERLYGLLNDQHALSRQNWFKELPLVRLVDGTQVAAGELDTPNAFLEAPVGLERLRVRASVCRSEVAREFLVQLGLREFDPVDQVKTEVLPKYLSGETSIDDETYGADIVLLSNLYRNSSAELRQRLVRALQTAPFVRVADAATNDPGWATPREAYLATTTVGALFNGLAGVRLVDSSLPELATDSARDLLLACGVADGLRLLPVTLDHQRSAVEWRTIREIVGSPRTTLADEARDWTIEHLAELLDRNEAADLARRAEVAALLWQELCTVAWQPARHFRGTYQWFYYRERSRHFPAAFIRQLNEREWVPNAGGGFGKPGEVIFDSLGWPRHDSLLEQIEFLPPPDPGDGDEDLSLVSGRIGVSARLLIRLGEMDVPEEELEAFLDQWEERAAMTDKHQGPSSSALDRTGTIERPDVPAERANRPASGRETFRSYVAVHQDGPGDPDERIEHEQRMRIEEAAVEFILQLEPDWRRTPTNNPGFDLYRADEAGDPVQWCEVKSLRGAWSDQPVTMTRNQFDLAREKRDAFWLYVVDHAASEERRLYAIQDPAGRAELFSFDRGWDSISRSTTRSK